ncbi:MAG: HEAT repeat domain-containing protein, partial [bacterium]
MLSDSSGRVRRAAIALLDRNEESLGELAEIVLTDPDPIVRSIGAGMVASDQARPVIDEMLSSNEAPIVTAALSALASHPALSAVTLVAFAEHPDRQVRAAAARAMAPRSDSTSTLRSMLDDSSILVRAAAAASLASSPRSVATLTDVLASGSVRASEAALVAMTEAGLGTDLLAAWIAAEVDRARFLRQHHLALKEAYPSPTLSYLRRLLLMRQQRLERWALLAFKVPDMEEAMPWLRRGVWSRDPDTRAYSLEALDSMDRRSAVRRLIPLLEDVPPDAVPDSRTSLRALAHDHDEWIRALAVRCLFEDPQFDIESVRRAVEGDPSGLVREAVSRWPSTGMESTQLLSLVDRVLALQRVAMFSEIDPE